MAEWCSQQEMTQCQWWRERWPSSLLDSSSDLTDSIKDWEKILLLYCGEDKTGVRSGNWYCSLLPWMHLETKTLEFVHLRLFLGNKHYFIPMSCAAAVGWDKSRRSKGSLIIFDETGAAVVTVFIITCKCLIINCNNLLKLLFLTEQCWVVTGWCKLQVQTHTGTCCVGCIKNSISCLHWCTALDTGNHISNPTRFAGLVLICLEQSL